jgi:hypothetical protein
MESTTMRRIGRVVVLLAVVAVVFVPPAAAEEVLTNESVIQMTRAGLPDGVIIAKIRSSRTQFDLRTESLISLKGAGVSSPVIEAMVTQGAPAPGAAAAPPPAGASRPAAPVAAVPVAAVVKDREVIYHANGEQLVEMVPTVAELETNFAFFQNKAELVLEGRKAKYRTAERQPVFLSAYPPSEAPLVKLKPGDEHDDRNLKFSSGSFFPFGGTQRQGVRGEDKIDVDSEKDARGLFRIRPRKPLPPGEYGFVLAVGAGGTGGKIYDFGVD